MFFRNQVKKLKSYPGKSEIPKHRMYLINVIQPTSIAGCKFSKFSFEIMILYQLPELWIRYSMLLLDEKILMMISFEIKTIIGNSQQQTKICCREKICTTSSRRIGVFQKPICLHLCAKNEILWTRISSSISIISYTLDLKKVIPWKNREIFSFSPQVQINEINVG